MQAELFRKDQYGVAKCPKCGALGTIVELGACCRVAAMAAQPNSALMGQGAALAVNDPQRNETKE